MNKHFNEHEMFILYLQIVQQQFQLFFLCYLQLYLITEDPVETTRALSYC